jgi:hypothetical protein
MAENGQKVVIQKKQEDTAFFVEALTNKYNGQRQIQVNDTYLKDGELNYARRGVNIDVIDIPEVVKAMISLYQDETGKVLDVVEA